MIDIEKVGARIRALLRVFLEVLRNIATIGAIGYFADLSHSKLLGIISQVGIFALFILVGSYLWDYNPLLAHRFKQRTLALIIEMLIVVPVGTWLSVRTNKLMLKAVSAIVAAQETKHTPKAAP